MAKGVHARLFWSGGSQAVRLPKSMRLPGDEVLLRRRDDVLEVVPLAPGNDWSGFWDRLLPVKHPVKRWKTKVADRRKPL